MFQRLLLCFLILVSAHSACVVNGIVQRNIGQECDPSISFLQPCNDQCQLTCGNQRNNTQTGEDCDPSAGYNGDIPCSDNCKFCGNGQLDQQIQDCDKSDPNYTPGVDLPCNQLCETTCGNGQVQTIYGEQCQIGEQGCSQNCQLTCGNGIIDANEFCDPSADSSLECLQDCTLCGNGQVDTISSQQCDPAILTIPCFSDCTKSCGNGQIERFLLEQCQPTLSNVPCDPNSCKLTCGNGVLDTDEQCDPTSSDPNERGTSCNPITCIDTCGNNRLDSGQQCDIYSGNIRPCNDNCQITCGNGEIDTDSSPPQQCDPTASGFDIRTCDSLTCTQILASSLVVIQCGNGIVEEPQQCDDKNSVNNDFCANDCTLTTAQQRCGNGVLDVGQQCDFSVSNFCDSTCKTTLTTCGNGQIQNNEQCDDLNKINNDGCSSFCEIQDGFVCFAPGQSCSKCGNRVVDDGQQCDDGNRDNTDSCSNRCQVNNLSNCGNGIVDNGQGCDDGNDSNFDGCTNRCTVLPNWVCQTNQQGRSVCSKCGNGQFDAGQQCDDNNRNSGDGCSNCRQQEGWNCQNFFTCEEEQVGFCTDGKFNPDRQECDDGNLRNSDGCNNLCERNLAYNCINVVDKTSVCTLIPTQEQLQCGNGERNQNQQCDDGDTDDTNGCKNDCTIDTQNFFTCTDVLGQRSQCQIFNPCGNGLKEKKYFQQCDDGNPEPNDGCTNCFVDRGYNCIQNSLNRSICFLNQNNNNNNDNDNDNNGQDNQDGQDQTEVPRCGNGIVQQNQQCDDNNNDQGDGCGPNCLTEQYFNCVGQPSQCTQFYFPPECGNGKVQFGQNCDDNNNVNGDGCNSNCFTQSGFVCIEGQGCQKLCGNGQINDGQQCDDRNEVSGDGCDSSCSPQLGFNCVVLPSGRSLCTRTCGNGELQRDQFQQCDDDNFVSGDGCDAQCQIQDGFKCNGQDGDTSVCFQVLLCGNDVVDDGEQCDDGGNQPNDGCDPKCQLQQSGQFECDVVDGQSTCFLIEYCPTGMKLPERSLARPVLNALPSVYTGVRTFADVLIVSSDRQPNGVGKGNLTKQQQLLNFLSIQRNLAPVNSFYLEYVQKYRECFGQNF